VLARVGAGAWAAATSLKAPRAPSGSVKDLGHALTSDPDPVTRGLAALALRDQGQPAVAALPELMTGLRDKDVSVRMMSANALAAIGKDAAPAVPALIVAGSVKEEQVHVLRSVAAALGAIGKPAASPALPLLREFVKMPRVRWAAESAIRRIE
jgi:HEAT repeat protein